MIFLFYLSVHLRCLNIPNISNTCSSHQPQKRCRGRWESRCPNHTLSKEQACPGCWGWSTNWDAILCCQKICWIKHIHICLFFFHRISLHIPDWSWTPDPHVSASKVLTYTHVSPYPFHFCNFYLQYARSQMCARKDCSGIGWVSTVSSLLSK